MRGRDARALRFVACLVLTTTFTARSTVAAVTPVEASAAEREEAQSAFQRGRDHFAKGHYEAALEAFGRSLDVVESPNTRLYVARCKRALGDLVGAHDELSRAEATCRDLERADPRYARTRAAAEEERAQLEAKLALLTVDVASPAPRTEVTVLTEAGRRTAGAGLERVALSPGPVEIVVTADGRPPQRRALVVAAGEHKRVTIEATPPEPEAGTRVAAAPPPQPERRRVSLRPFAIASAGVGVFGLATFAVFGVMARTTYADLERDCGGGPCGAGYDDRIASGRSQQLAANVGLTAFAVGAAAAITLFVLDRRAGRRPVSAGLVDWSTLARGAF